MSITIQALLSVSHEDPITSHTPVWRPIPTRLVPDLPDQADDGDYGYVLVMCMANGSNNRPCGTLAVIQVSKVNQT